MLYSVPDMKRIDSVPYFQDYLHLRHALDRIDPTAFDRIHAVLLQNFNGKEIDTSSWIPGADWTGTVYDPIYHACGQDQEAAARFFGLIVWQVVMDHPDCWASGRYEKDGLPLRGRTYFRIDCP
jgi:hypothetical protein